MTDLAPLNAALYLIAELTRKVYGRDTDRIRIRETVRLNGEGLHGRIRSRFTADGDSRAEVPGMTDGNAAYARGHVDSPVDFADIWGDALEA